MADVPYVGFTVLIMAGDDLIPVERLRNELMRMAWERRQDFVYEVEPVADSMARAKRLQEGPIVLVDHGDNVFSGGPRMSWKPLPRRSVKGLPTWPLDRSGILNPSGR